MAESFNGYEENPASDNLEFYLVVSALRAKFEKAKQEQQSMGSYDMFTVVGSSPEVYAKIRIADRELIQVGLDTVSHSDESLVDVALPIESVDVDNPILVDSGERSGRFLLYGPASDQELPTVITAANIYAFIDQHPDFVKQSVAYEPIPIRKSGTEVA